jgi:hypothetical protein
MIETILILGVLVVDLPGIGMIKFNKDYQNIQNADVEKLIDYKNTIEIRSGKPDIEWDEWAQTYAIDRELISSFYGPICSFTGKSIDTISEENTTELLFLSLSVVEGYGGVNWGEKL